jgi:hypothetical protein
MLSNFLFVLDGLSLYLVAGAIMFYLASKLAESEAEYLRRRNQQ